MLKWLKSDPKATKATEQFRNVTEGLQKTYKEKLLPLEKATMFGHCEEINCEY
jgi:hypothetical protein